MSDGNLKIGAIVDIEQLHAGMASSVQEIKSATSQMGISFQELSKSHTANMQAISDDTRAMAGSVSPAFIGVAKASLEISAALKEQRAAMAEARASAGEDTAALNILAAAKQRVATATLELAEAQQLAGIRTDNLGRATGEATGSLALMGEEIGVRLNRHLRNFAAELPTIGPLMASAFNAFAIIGLLEILPRLVGKITEVAEQIAGLTKGVKDQYESVVKYNEYLMEHFSDNKIGQGYLNFNSAQIAANEAQIASLRKLGDAAKTNSHDIYGMALASLDYATNQKDINKLIDENARLTANANAIREQMHVNSQKAAEEDSKAKQKAIDESSREYQAQERTNQEITRGIAERDDRILQSKKRVAGEQQRLDKEVADALQKSLEDIDRAYVRSFDKQQEEAVRANAEIEDAAIEHARNLLKIETDTLNFELALGKITTQGKIKELKTFEQQEYESEKLALQAKLALYAADSRAYEQVLKQLQKIEDQHRQQQIVLDRQGILARTAQWNQYVQHMAQTFQTSINGMIQGSQTFSQAIARMGQSMIADFANMLVQRMAKWIEHLTAQTVANQVSNQVQVAQNASAAAEKNAISFTETIKQVSRDAVKAATGAYQAVVGIPIIGPALAPIAAGVAFAGVEAFGALASASGGMMVDRDQLAIVHKDERVLPARYSAGLDQMVGNAANGTGASAQAIGAAVRNAIRGMRTGPSEEDIVRAIEKAFKRGSLRFA